MLAILGSWGDPIDTNKHPELALKVVERFKCRCVYCNFVSVITSNNPFGGLSICTAKRGLSIEPKSCVPLCDMCVRLNSLDNLVSVEGEALGTFVELPQLKQSQLNMLVRVAAVYNYLATQEGTRDVLNDTPIHRVYKGFLRDIKKVPYEWEKLHFDGSPQALIAALDSHNGYHESMAGMPYINRLRFVYSNSALEPNIPYWAALLESDCVDFVNGGLH